MTTALVIDNYDSFTYNLVQMFRAYPLDILVYRSDGLTLKEAKALDPDYIIISPGPRDPAHAGISIELIQRFSGSTPILGICLGMQCINEAFGGATVRAPLPVHGKTSTVYHIAQGLFEGIPIPFSAARYHSLMAEPGDGSLIITAETNKGVIMGMSHPERPLCGVQFHPESFLTQYGFQLIENFLKLGPVSAESLKFSREKRTKSATDESRAAEKESQAKIAE
jgi:anthranilate synthase component 2